MTLGAPLAKTFASLASARHVGKSVGVDELRVAVGSQRSRQKKANL